MLCMLDWQFVSFLVRNMQSAYNRSVAAIMANYITSGSMRSLMWFFDVVGRKIRHHNGSLPWLFSMIMVWKWKFKKFWKIYQKTECMAWSIYVRWKNRCFTIWLISNMFASVTEWYRNLVPNFGLRPNSRGRMTGVWTLKDEMYKTVDELRRDLQL
jgi:hypothetical protein